MAAALTNASALEDKGLRYSLRYARQSARSGLFAALLTGDVTPFIGKAANGRGIYRGPGM
jgi:hypothetical protein